MLLYELGLTWGFSQVPVIALFTKYDQFRRNIKMRLEDEGRDPKIYLDAKVESVFQEYYLAALSGRCGPPPFIRLESEDSDFVSDKPIFC